MSHRAEIAVKTTEKQRRGKQVTDELKEHEAENGGFVFALFETCTTMAGRFPSLTQADLARLMFVGTYTGWRSGRLEYDNGRVIDRKGLEKLIGISRPKFSTFFKKLITEQIVQEVGKEIIVNPSVFYRGSLKEAKLDKLDEYRHTRLFRKTVRDLYELHQGKKTAQLAVIYAVLPFLNFNTNIACFNPQENNGDELRPMSLENVAAALGYQDTHKLKVALEAAKVDGKPVFWLPPNVNDKRQRRIIANPRVVYAGNAESLKAVKAMFN
ncbi:hypothetical protein [Peribacillus simplex]|uniref:hypothetical protein n=2 Tax=Peribacillus TaxID=2675229 RepID=UPI00386E40F5